MSIQFFTAVEGRRSIYGLSDEMIISNDKIVGIVEESVKHAPSAFNSQSARTIILFGSHHKKLWSITKEILRKIAPADKFESTELKIDSFKAGAGTILFFEDMSVVEDLQQQFPTYAEKFPVWSLQSSGMVQFIIWTALEAEGLGVNLQHYNPLIDNDVAKTWGAPLKWKLISQMVFGKPTAKPSEKTFLRIEERVKIFTDDVK